MAWPIDTRDESYTALTAVPSDNLNEIQDRIIDIHNVRSRTFINGMVESVGGASGWDYNHAAPRGWVNVNAGRLLIPIAFKSLNPIIQANGVSVKYYISAAVGLDMELFLCDAQFGAAATVPTSSSLDSYTSTGGSPPDWRITTFSFSAQALDEDQYLAVVFTNPDAGDIVAGVKVEFQPITPT